MNNIKLQNSYRKNSKLANRAGIYRFTVPGLTRFRVLYSRYGVMHNKKFRHRAWAKAKVLEVENLTK